MPGRWVTRRTGSAARIVGIAQSASGFNKLPSLRAGAVEQSNAGCSGPVGYRSTFNHFASASVPDPTSLMFRNLMAIDVEEMVRAQPWMRSC